MSVMSQPAKSATLRVPGATLYYEVRGAGPVLLLIPGGPMDAGAFADLAGHLSDRYTVVTYDPRGNSRSTFDGPPEPLNLDVQADDAAYLIDALGSGPAYVFGTSGGAQIGLNLAARHPDRVRALVAHEPPAIMLLDDPSAALAADQELYDTYRREGVEAAMAKFLAMTGLEDDPGQTAWENGEAGETPPEGEAFPEGMGMPTPEEMETFARIEGNYEYWLAHGMLPLSTYRPDVDTLRSGQPRIVVAIGEQSAGELVDQTSSALARHLEVEPVTFPGDHMAFGTEAGPFAERLAQALANA